jgi:hypothetical protein
MCCAQLRYLVERTLNSWCFVFGERENKNKKESMSYAVHSIGFPPSSSYF